MSVPTPATNLLAMPLVVMSVSTGTNEDWIDSILFLVDDGGDVQESFPQLDLTGIEFNMEVRRRAPDNEVVLRGSTKDGSLSIGDPPNYGYLVINIDHEKMKMLSPGAYVADIVGTEAPELVRRCVTIDLDVVLGITRP
jgi:hypothetical protein